MDSYDSKKSHNVSNDTPSLDRDAAQLALMGKRQVLKRNFGFLSLLGFSCTILSTWEGLLITFIDGFLNGGPGALVYQYILVWGGTLCVCMCLAELASMAPTAGGQYHFVSMLAPRSMRNFLSYVTGMYTTECVVSCVRADITMGWLGILAWVAVIASSCVFTAAMTQGLCLANYPSYATTAHPYQVTLMSYAVIIVSILLNTVIGGVLPKAEGIFLVLHILGFFGILIPLVYYGPKGNASEIFATRLNEGGWPTYGLSFMIGTLGIAFAFQGADCAIHMSEEIVDPSINIPRAIVTTVIINGALGFGMLFAVLFCMGDPQAALAAADTVGYPFIEIFRQATGSVAGSSVMTSILIVMSAVATVGFMATTSRMIWSFARDRGLPFSEFLGRVDQRTAMPLYALAVASIIPGILVLIKIGSSTAFNDVTSLAVNALFTTYLMSMGLLLYRRDTGDYDLTWGPWHLPGWFGILNNIISLAFLFVIWLFAFFPTNKAVDASKMNYSSLVLGAAFLFSVAYYFIKGKKQYNGPIIEILP